MPKRDASGLLVPFATCGDGEIRHVMQIEKAARGPFTCLGCGEQLSLRRPAAKRNHFAHRPDSRCSGETALHIYAKVLLAKSRRITFPSLVISEGRARELVFQGGNVALRRVLLELADAGFQPDAIVEVGSERRAIEFKVSHAVDVAKKARVKAAGCPMIEIDLSSIRWRRLDQNELDDQILHRAPRHWIYHPDHERAARRLAERVRAEVARRGDRLRWHIRLRPQDPQIDREWMALATSEVAAAELDYLTGRSSPMRHWFTVPTMLWQTALVHALILKPSVTFTPRTDVQIRGAWPNEQSLASVLPRWMLRTDLADYGPKALAAAGFTRESFGSPHEAVTDFLFDLASQTGAVFWDRNGQRFFVNPDLHARLARRHDLERMVRGICEAADHPDPSDLTSRWMRRYNAAGRSPWEAAGIGGKVYQDLEARVRAIRDMEIEYRAAPIVDDLCGLPLREWRDGLRRKRAEKEAARLGKLEQDRSRRRGNLQRAAERALGSDSKEWLASTMVDDLPIAAWACESDDRYWEAMERVDAAETARNRRFKVAKAAEALRGRLTLAAEERFGDLFRAKVFLNSAHPGLDGRRPIEFCETEAELRIVLTLLPRR